MMKKLMKTWRKLDKEKRKDKEIKIEKIIEL